jgi:hypothetical protein
VANAGWDKWTPINALAIGAHLVGSVGQLKANKERVAQQQVSAAENPPSKSGTKPSKRTNALAPEVAAAQQQLDTLQWVIPALTGALVAVSSYAGEQQRASEVATGTSSPTRAATAPAAAQPAAY